MAYQKRYEDSYLDDENEDTDGLEKTDRERILALLEKAEITPKEEARIAKLVERLFAGIKSPGLAGEQAVYEIEAVAKAYANLGQPDMAVTLWERLGNIAGIMGKNDLYYRAMDEIATASGATYEEYHHEN